MIVWNGVREADRLDADGLHSNDRRLTGTDRDGARRARRVRNAGRRAQTGGNRELGGADEHGARRRVEIEHLQSPHTLVGTAHGEAEVAGNRPTDAIEEVSAGQHAHAGHPAGDRDLVQKDRLLRSRDIHYA